MKCPVTFLSIFYGSSTELSLINLQFCLDDLPWLSQQNFKVHIEANPFILVDFWNRNFSEGFYRLQNILDFRTTQKRDML